MKESKGKVLIVVGDATETVDTLYPYYRLIEAGFHLCGFAAKKQIPINSAQSYLKY